MTHRACSEQPDILTAAAEAREIPAAFAAHLASCPSCREQVDAVTFLRGLAAAPVASHPLPDPAVILVEGAVAAPLAGRARRVRPDRADALDSSSRQDSPAWPSSSPGSGRAW